MAVRTLAPLCCRIGFVTKWACDDDLALYSLLPVNTVTLPVWLFFKYNTHALHLNLHLLGETPSGVHPRSLKTRTRAGGAVPWTPTNEPVQGLKFDSKGDRTWNLANTQH